MLRKGGVLAGAAYEPDQLRIALRAGVEEPQVRSKLVGQCDPVGALPGPAF